MNNKINNYRHGDLSYHKIDKLPDGLKKVEHDGNFVLARGEHTGHKHVVTAPRKEMNIYQDAEGRYVLEIKEAATIAHEEHSTITLQPGIYIQETELERDPFLDAIRSVQD